MKEAAGTLPLALRCRGVARGPAKRLVETPGQEEDVLQAASLTVVLSLLWLLLSGYWDNSLIIGLGGVSVFVTVAIAWRMDVLDGEGHPVHLLFRALTYWPWLLKEIVLANLDVAKAILGVGGAKVDATMFTVPASQTTDVGRVTYANSITLTPGTVSVSVDDDRIAIHALTRDAVEGLATGEMDRRVRALEGISP